MKKRYFHSIDSLRFFAFLKVYLLHLPIQGDFPIFSFVLQFQCQQLTTQMDVAYTMNLNDTSSQGQVGSEVVVHKRNVMVAIGCGCVQSRPRRLQQFMQMMVEKKKRNQESGRSIGDGERISSNSN